MALYSSRNICLRPVTWLAFQKGQTLLYTTIHDSLRDSLKDERGILDDFTSQLMQKKSCEWQSRKRLAEKKISSKKIVPEITNNGVNKNLVNLDISSINGLFQKACNCDDSMAIRDLTKQCVAHDRVPSLNNLLDAMSVCSNLGDQNTIIEVSKLCEKIRPEIQEGNPHLEHYVAEAVWIKGNVNKSLKIFERIYRENVSLRRLIRSTLKSLILNSVASHSEATIINLLQFSKMLVNEYNDYFTLGCLWQACILSEWFTDQEVALDLLDEYAELHNVIVGKIPFVVGTSLRHHRTEVVYRLTEVLLRAKMESEIRQILLALLDYWIKQGDFRQCKEIIRWSIQNDVQVPTVIYSGKLMEFLSIDDVRTKPKAEIPKRAPADYKW